MGLLADLLSWVDSRKRVAKRNIGDLITTGKTRANYLAGLLDPNSQISQDAQAWHKRTQNGLMDQLAGRDTPEAEQAYQTMMQAAGMAPVGMIAWHGSPHKFDKFSLDKIGTGEGAQAYGHGLYLAESPAVAQQYQMMGSKVSVRPTNDGMLEVLAGPRDGEMKSFGKFNANDAAKKRDELNLQFGNLYKTDIPDEAVARFLDWDKPLSQQAPEVQKAVKLGWSKNYPWLKDGPNVSMTGAQIYDALGYLQRADSTSAWKDAGIPGIRYLDGGSRSAGQGSSNFVVFSPDMIRILERNGQPTGNTPWKLGEWAANVGK